MRQWFSFQGRIRRRVWWLLYVLPLIVLGEVGAGLDIALGLVVVLDLPAPEGFAFGTPGIGPFGVGIGPFYVLTTVATIWGFLAGEVKRWHDRDKSGWWVLIALVPLVGGIWAIVVKGFLAGTPGPNRFGPDPRVGKGCAPSGAPPPAAA